MHIRGHNMHNHPQRSQRCARSTLSEALRAYPLATANMWMKALSSNTLFLCGGKPVPSWVWHMRAIFTVTNVYKCRMYVQPVKNRSRGTVTAVDTLRNPPSPPLTTGAKPASRAIFFVVPNLHSPRGALFWRCFFWGGGVLLFIVVSHISPTTSYDNSSYS